MAGYLIDFKQIDEADGSLVFMEGNAQIPFEIKRVFYVFNASSDSERANHANKNTDFVLICVHGSVRVELDDGTDVQVFHLDSANKGVYIPKMTWMRTFDFENDAVLLALASERYQENQYYEDYDEFLCVKELERKE